MLRAYFDTNVYSGLPKGRISPDDERALRAALTAHALEVRVSVGNIEELLVGLDDDRAGVVARLQTARHLVGFQGMLKAPADILTEAYQAYGDGTDPPRVAAPELERRRLVLALSDFLAGSRRHDAKLRLLCTEVVDLQQEWRTKMTDARDQALARLDWPSRDEEDRQLSFKDFFTESGAGWAEALARPPSCADACRQRGLDGLIQVRTVRLCVGVVLSQIFSQTVGTPPNPDFRKAASSDAYDVWHAILASTADVFFTLDGRLADHIKRIPDVPGFHVATSVPELLELVTAAGSH